MNELRRNARVRGLSIVCVFNDAQVRGECLDRSIDRYTGDVDVDYIPIDNREQQFSTAGAALNHGAALAKHEVVAFAHQDVYLHSIDRLAEACGPLLDGTWTVLGASGMTSSSELVGTMRDRTDVVGLSADSPVEVETLDEVLFMVRRETILAEPLTKNPDLAWHAYAVEYCLRSRAVGSRVGAIDTAITHNSLTVNLARLDVAHRVVGSLYPDLTPINTTCGVVRPPRARLRDLPLVRDHKWRLRWVKNSVAARSLKKQGAATVVLSDIRHDVDLLAFDNSSPLYIINLAPNGNFATYSVGWLDFQRLGKKVVFAAEGTMVKVSSRVKALSASENVLVAGLDSDTLKQLREQTPWREWVAGIQSGPMWALSGQVATELPESWMRPPVSPLSALSG